MMALSVSMLPLVSVVLAVTVSGEKYIGSFTTHYHKTAGKVFAVDEQTLRIEDFEYDGEGPDAFFVVGTTETTGGDGTILPHPFAGKFYDYEDRSAPKLEGIFEGDNITLTLPTKLKVSDIKWLSVWCRTFEVNFGDLTANFELDAESEPRRFRRVN